MADLTSNIVLQTESPPGNLSGFQQTLEAIRAIDRALKDLAGTPVTIDIRVNDNVIQQAKQAGQQINQALTAGGQQAAGLTQQVNATTDSLIRQRKVFDGLGTTLEKQVDTHQRIAAGVRITTDLTTTLNKETGEYARTSKVVTTDLKNNVDAIKAGVQAQERLNERQQNAINRARTQRAATNQGFQPVTDETGRNVGDRKGFKLLQREVSDTVDEFVKLDSVSGRVLDRFERPNAGRVRQVKEDAEAASRATRAQNLANQALADGFTKISERIKVTADGTQQLVGVYTKLSNSPINQLLDTQAVAIREINSVTGTLTTRTLEGAAAGRFIGDSFLTAARKVALWTATTGAIFGAIGLFKEAAAATLELERNTVLLARVGSGFGTSTESQLAGARALTNQLVELSAFYGVSATEAQQAASIFARSGLTVEETSRATTAAIIASKIAELDLVEAAKLLSAAQSQFGLSSGQLLSTLNQLNALSNNYRVTTGDLLQSISRSGAVFADYGSTLNELAATTAVLAQSTARAGGEIGNALKTIVSNLERSDVATKLLEKTGVAFRTDGEDATNFAESLAVLQQQFATLTKTQQDNLSISVAGVRQRNIFVTAVRDATQIAIAEVRSLEQSKSATDELKLASSTLTAGLERLQAQIFKVANSVGSLDALKEIVNTITSIINALAPFSGIIARFTVFVALFVSLRFILASIILPLLNFGKTLLFITTAANGLKDAFVALNSVGGIVTIIAAAASVAFLAVASALNAQADAARNAKIEQEKKAETDREAATNAGKLAAANKTLLNIFKAQAEELREIEQRLNSRQAVSDAGNQNNQQVNLAPISADNQADIERATILKKSLSDLASQLGHSKQSVQEYADTLNVLAEVEPIVNKLTDDATKKLKDQGPVEKAIIDAGLKRLSTIEDTKKALQDISAIARAQKLPLGAGDTLFERLKNLSPVETVVKLLGEGTDAAKRFAEVLDEQSFFSELIDGRDVVKALDAAIIKLEEDVKKDTKAVEDARTSLDGLKKAQEDLTRASEKFALAKRIAETIREVKDLKKEIQAVADTNQLFKTLEGPFNLDKVITKERELQEILQQRLDIQRNINQLLKDKANEAAKEISKEQLQPILKQELVIRTEQSRNTIEQLAKFIKGRLEDAFTLDAATTRRTLLADRRFFDISEDLDQLSTLEASFKQTENSAKASFQHIKEDSKRLADELERLAAEQNNAAANFLASKISEKTGVPANKIPFGAGVLSPAARRRQLEEDIKNRALFSSQEQREIIAQSRTRAANVPITENLQALLARIQTTREFHARKLNELGDTQLKIAEELIGKEKEITAELKTQTNEQIKQLGLLGEEDKLRVLAQASFFAKNPNFVVSAEQQFFAPAEDNRILSEFFPGHRAKEFDPNSLIGRLFLAAGFGSERSRQLQGAQAEIAKQRQEFVGKDKNGKDILATDQAIIDAAIERVKKLREAALNAIEQDISKFLDKVREQNPDFDKQLDRIRVGGAEFNAGRVTNDITVTPTLTEESLTQFRTALETTVNKAVNKAFITLKENILELQRSIQGVDFELENPPKVDDSKIPPFPGKRGQPVPRPPNAGAGGAAFSLSPAPFIAVSPVAGQTPAQVIAAAQANIFRQTSFARTPGILPDLSQPAAVPPPTPPSQNLQRLPQRPHVQGGPLLIDPRTGRAVVSAGGRSNAGLVSSVRLPDSFVGVLAQHEADQLPVPKEGEPDPLELRKRQETLDRILKRDRARIQREEDARKAREAEDERAKKKARDDFEADRLRREATQRRLEKEREDRARAFKEQEERRKKAGPAILPAGDAAAKRIADDKEAAKIMQQNREAHDRIDKMVRDAEAARAPRADAIDAEARARAARAARGGDFGVVIGRPGEAPAAAGIGRAPLGAGTGRAPAGLGVGTRFPSPAVVPPNKAAIRKAIHDAALQDELEGRLAGRPPIAAAVPTTKAGIRKAIHDAALQDELDARLNRPDLRRPNEDLEKDLAGGDIKKRIHAAATLDELDRQQERMSGEAIAERARQRAAAQARTKSKIQELKHDKVVLPNGQLGTIEGLQQTENVIERSKAGKVELPNGQFADPAGLKRTQDRIDQIKKRDAENAAKTKEAIENINIGAAGAKFEPAAPLGNILKGDGGGPTTSPNSPLGRVNAARKEIYERQRAETKANYEQAKKDRQNAYQNRGEIFYQQQMQRMDFFGSSSGIKKDYRIEGNIPGVPGEDNRLPLPRVLPREVQKIGPLPPGAVEPPKPAAGAGASLQVNPNVDWGPLMASFEQTFSSSIVSSFARAMPQIVQLVSNGLANLPARPAQAMRMNS